MYLVLILLAACCSMVGSVCAMETSDNDVVCELVYEKNNTEPKHDRLPLLNKMLFPGWSAKRVDEYFKENADLGMEVPIQKQTKCHGKGPSSLEYNKFFKKQFKHNPHVKKQVDDVVSDYEPKSKKEKRALKKRMFKVCKRYDPDCMTDEECNAYLEKFKNDPVFWVDRIRIKNMPREQFLSEMDLNKLTIASCLAAKKMEKQ